MKKIREPKDNDIQIVEKALRIMGDAIKKPRNRDYFMGSGFLSLYSTWIQNLRFYL